MNYDIYLVGVGGQGVLTIGEIIADAMHHRNIPAQFYPTEGMAQRGGFVKAQLRLGRAAGPNIPERSADLVISMELSEALKAVRYVRPDGDFLLWTHIWAPTAVTLGKANYPTREQIQAEIAAAGARLHLVEADALPSYKDRPLPANLYVLGAALRQTRLSDLFTLDDLLAAVQARWPRHTEVNAAAINAGYAVTP